MIAAGYPVYLEQDGIKNYKKTTWPSVRQLEIISLKITPRSSIVRANYVNICYAFRLLERITNIVYGGEHTLG